MFRNPHSLIILICCLFLTACSHSDPKVTKEQASSFSTVIEGEVKDSKIDFLEKNILAPVFIKKINKAGNTESSVQMENEIRTMLGNNQSEKSIYDLMSGAGSFQQVKQYEKDGNQHIIFRVKGSGGFTYLDMELASFQNRVGIADMFLYSTGQNLSASLADLIKKFSSHENSTVAGQIKTRLNNISRHLKNANYEMAKAEFEKLPYNIRNTRLYETRYLDIMSKIGGQEYLDYQQKIETKYADDAGFQLMMIDVYLNQGKYDKALASINQVDSVINKDPFLDYYRGLVLNMKGDPDEAIRHFEKMLAADPKFAEAYPELVASYSEKKDYSRASRYFNLYKNMNSADTGVINYLQTNFPTLE